MTTFRLLARLGWYLGALGALLVGAPLTGLGGRVGMGALLVSSVLSLALLRRARRTAT